MVTSLNLYGYGILAFDREVTGSSPTDAVYQGPSKNQQVSSTPVTKVKKMIVVFWDFLVE